MFEVSNEDLLLKNDGFEILVEDAVFGNFDIFPVEVYLEGINVPTNIPFINKNIGKKGRI